MQPRKPDQLLSKPVNLTSPAQKSAGRNGTAAGKKVEDFYLLLSLYFAVFSAESDEYIDSELHEFEQHDESAAEVETECATQGTNERFQLQNVSLPFVSNNFAHIEFRFLVYGLYVERLVVDLCPGVVLLDLLLDAQPRVRDLRGGVAQVQRQVLPVLRSISRLVCPEPGQESTWLEGQVERVTRPRKSRSSHPTSQGQLRVRESNWCMVCW